MMDDLIEFKTLTCQPIDYISLPGGLIEIRVVKCVENGKFYKLRKPIAQYPHSDYKIRFATSSITDIAMPEFSDIYRLGSNNYWVEVTPEWRDA